MEREREKSESWRVVVVTNLPGGFIYSLLDQILTPLGHRIVGVVTSPGPPRRRSAGYRDVVAAVSPNVDVLVSNHPSRWAAMLAPLQPDFIISGGMPWRLPRDVIELPRLGAINIHPALLPRHRGPAPVAWAFRSGDAETGVTIHRIAPDFDTGPILAQKRVSIDDDDNFESLLGKFGPVIPELVIEALGRVARGEPGKPQDESKATYAGLLDDEWTTIDWREPARAIHNKVRSLGEFRQPPGAVGEIEGRTVRIARTRLLPSDPETASAPGSVTRRNGGDFIIQCGDGPLAIVTWAFEPV